MSMSKKMIAAVLLLAPLAALGHDKPNQTPQVVEKTRTDRDGWIVAGILAAGLVGAVIWCNTREKEEKKVAVVPTEDGKGAKVSFEWRH
jgi:hypothetical protein